jgi:CRISPR-associated protein Cas5t
MKNVFKIEISTWTSSFRYPNIISGFQPTLEVPPLSTVLGLINATAGKYLDFNQQEIGYYFEYGTKAIDVEILYQVDKISKDKPFPSLRATSNVIKREFLTDCKLVVYTENELICNYLLNPVYPVLLGRSSDLAQVRFLGKIETMSCVENAAKIKGQIVPFMNNYMPGVIQPLPQYFTNTEIRKNIGTQAYSVIAYTANDCQSHIKAYKDHIYGKEIDIYFHKLDFNEN